MLLTTVMVEMAQGASSNNGLKTVISIASMKRQDLTPKAVRKFKCTTDRKHKMPVYWLRTLMQRLRR